MVVVVNMRTDQSLRVETLSRRIGSYGRSLIPLATALWCLTAQTFGQSDRSVLPTETVILENELVRVLEIRSAPGGVEAIHSHRRAVTIAMSDYDNETTSVPGGRVIRSHRRFGEVMWAEPDTHETRNTGATEQHVVRVELKNEARPAKRSPADPLDALVACNDTQKLIFENAYVRAIEDRGPAGNVTAKHTHPRGVLIALSDYETESSAWPDRSVSRGHAAKGDVRWSEAVTHDVKNVGATPTYAVRIDVK